MADIIDFNDAPRQLEPGSKDHTRLLLLKSLLNQNCVSFVKWLFPAVVIKNGDARIGDLNGSPGSSLQIALMGDMIGVWIDHADDSSKGGDFISLYAAAEGLDQRTQFPRIMEELEAWLGVGKKERSRSLKQIARESHKDEPNPAAEPLGAPTGTWHYLDENSAIIATVYRHDLSNGAKTYRPWDAVKGANKMPEIRPLYNLPGILHAEPIILVEGEKCADTLIKLDYAATTAMGGAHAPVDKTDWTGIKGKRVILWPDADIPGQTWLTRVSGYLQQLGCTVTAVAVPEGVPDGWDAADAAKDGTDIAGVIATAQKCSTSRFKFLSLAELAELPVPDWRIDNYLPSNGLALLYGASGSYKSFIAIDLSLHMAHGMPWCGRNTRKCGVAYIAAEGGFGISKRIRAWHQSHAMSNPANFFILPTAVNLLDPRADMDQLLNDMEQLRRYHLGIVVIDTLARSFFGGDENTAKDMNAFIMNCDRIRQTFNCLTMPIHHSGKDEDKGARGSSSLRAAMDTEIWVRRAGTSRRVGLFCTKQKEAEEAKPIHMDVIDVEVVNADGEIFNSAVMRPLTNPVQEKAYVGASQSAILDALEENQSGLTFMELVRKTNKSKSSITDALKSLLKFSLIIKEDDHYVLTVFGPE